MGIGGTGLVWELRSSGELVLELVVWELVGLV